MTPTSLPISHEEEPPAGLTLALADEAATQALARALAGHLRAGDLVCLIGDLGSGKTSFARGVIRALPPAAGTDDGEEEVPSPSFTLVQIYERRPAPVWHVDLYRLERPEEVAELGLEEAAGTAILLIEWPDRLGTQLPNDRLELRLSYAEDPEDAGARQAELTGHGAWQARLAKLDLADAGRASHA